MPLLELKVSSPEPDLSVRKFAIREAVNTLYSIGVVFRTKSPALDLEAIVGKPAEFHVVSGYQHVRLGGDRTWTGLCNQVELVQVEAGGLSTYALSIVPHLWLRTQKNDYRIFQHLSIPDIIDEVLDRWKMSRIWEIDRGRYKKLEFKVQYNESDFSFFARLLEEAGISFMFTHGDDQGSKLVLSDRLHTGEARPPLVYFDHMTQAAEREFITRVRLAREVRPGKLAMRDYDYRRPSYPLFGKAEDGAASEARYEQYHYLPSGFLVEGGAGGGTPVADDRGIARHEDAAGQDRATRALAARREGARAVSFETNAIDVSAGRVITLENHPHAWVAGGERLLVTDFTISGTHDLDWHMSGRAVFASSEYRRASVSPSANEACMFRSDQSRHSFASAGNDSGMSRGRRTSSCATSRFPSARIASAASFNSFGQRSKNSLAATVAFSASSMSAFAGTSFAVSSSSASAFTPTYPYPS